LALQSIRYFSKRKPHSVCPKLGNWFPTEEDVSCGKSVKSSVEFFLGGELKAKIMAISFVFDIRKAIAATAFLAEREAGKLDMFLSIKMLYVADKKALQQRGKTVTGDKMVAMPKGPILSRIYNLFKGQGTVDDLREWNANFSETVGNTIRLLKKPDLGPLSEEEMEILEAARMEINSVAPYEVADWLHANCPEWEDPHGSSRSIDPALILRNAGHTDAEILMIERSAETFKQIEKVFSSF